MTITVTKVQAQPIVNKAQGRFLDDVAVPAAAVVAVGFAARKVTWINLTDRITLEWYEGMAADSAVKTVAAGTRTLEVAAGITVTDSQFTVAAANVLQNKQYTYVAQA